MVEVGVSLRVGRSEHIVGDWPCMVVSSSWWSEHSIDLVVASFSCSAADSHLVDGKNSTQPLRLDLLKSPRSLPRGWGEGVEGPEEAGLLFHGD